jgi:hypothetical protein
VIRVILTRCAFDASGAQRAATQKSIQKLGWDSMREGALRA